MSTLALAGKQIRFELLTSVRNRTALLFTLAFPVMLLLFFGIIFKNSTADFDGRTLPSIQFYVPGLLAYGVIGACYTNLAMRVVILRDQGVLKRIKGTPLPRVAYMAGHIGASVVLGLLIALITVVIGVVLYGVHIPAQSVFAGIVSVIVGSACFCAIGLAVASVIPSSEGAAGIVNFTVLPILFISNVFYSSDLAPAWLSGIADIFPVKHFANALQLAFNPVEGSTGWSAEHLGIMAIWGVIGTLIAAKKFRWETSPAK